MRVKRAAKYGFCSGVRVADIKVKRFARGGGRGAILGQVPPGDGPVDPLDLAAAEGIGEGAMGLVVLGHEQQAGRVLVEAVHDARSQDAADAREVAHVVQQRIDQGAGAVAGRGVYDHARGLVDHEQVGVLVHDAEREILGLDVGGLGRGHRELDPVAGHGATALPGGGAVDRDATLLQQLDDAGAGEIRQARGQPAVEASAGVVLHEQAANGVVRSHGGPHCRRRRPGAAACGGTPPRAPRSRARAPAGSRPW